MSNSFSIRFVNIDDLDQVIELCALHAAYEKAEYDPTGKKERLTLDLFSNPPKLYCFVVEYKDELLGYATYMKQYATWDATEYIYMDCLFMKEAARGHGIGAQLIKRIQAEAQLLKCNLIQWQTPDFNTDAIRFYRRIGATSKPKERFFLEV